MLRHHTRTVGFNSDQTKQPIQAYVYDCFLSIKYIYVFLQLHINTYLYTFSDSFIHIRIKKMRNKRQLLIEQLDQKLVKFKEPATILVPTKGWINTIRTTINMTRDQLGTKLEMTKGAIQKIEERESSGQITINKLKNVGQALNMKFVYGFIPIDGSIENLISIESEKLARKIVLRTNQNMKLEDQGIGEEKINKTIKDLAVEIKREVRKSIWD